MFSKMIRSVASRAATRQQFTRSFAATKIDGTAISKAVREEVAAETAGLKAKHGDAAGTPGLAVVLVGARPDRYVTFIENVFSQYIYMSLLFCISYFIYS